MDRIVYYTVNMSIYLKISFLKKVNKLLKKSEKRVTELWLILLEKNLIDAFKKYRDKEEEFLYIIYAVELTWGNTLNLFYEI